jgi:excisionase family DNA binding protein
MVQNINLVQVSLDDMSSVIRSILIEELKKVGNYFNQDTTKSDDFDEYLTREDVCKKLKVSNTTLYNWNNEGVLKNYKVGRRVYYKKEDVKALINPFKAVS